ncbi:MAG: peptidoglycan editing factor PgeF [Candidatus Brocadiaceae bacterium]|nr:peptidoglycan editing factor PgeF [Candidatus Brocadiaceae bacterium]
MIEKQGNSLSLWLFRNLFDQKSIDHFISTRAGGCSNPPYDSLNLGLHVGDDKNSVITNREILAANLGAPLDNFTLTNQVHGAKVKIISDDMRGRGSIHSLEAERFSADAMITNVPNIYLMILLADCVPVLIFDRKKKVIGVIHAGWKGTVSLITQNTVKILKDTFHCSSKNLFAGIGPSIGPCCYAVGSEVVACIQEVFPDEKKLVTRKEPDGKIFFNLWEANRLQLLRMGIPEENIEISRICTSCHHIRLFSYRYQKRQTGRFGAGIMLKGTEAFFSASTKAKIV